MERAAHDTALTDTWRGQWQDALGAWGRYIKLAEPRWCYTPTDEEQQKLAGSFAMIRLTDHAVVISLRQVRELHLERFAAEVLAHEIGHHVLAPGDLRDNARLLARIRAGLPTRENYAPMVANLYTDLLINDRLQRSAGLDMAGVYRTLRTQTDDPVWQLYQRIYEILWSLPRASLAGTVEPSIDCDAGLGARLVRVYAKRWLSGAGRFAALLLPYLLKLPHRFVLVPGMSPWLDAIEAGKGGGIPDGMAEIDDGELTDIVHPSEDPEITGLDGRDKSTPSASGGAETKGGRKNNYREPQAYRELIKSCGVEVSGKELTIRYYRELAVPHLIRFPQRRLPEATDPYPEGLDTWDAGMPLHELDWAESLSRSPTVVPGVTTLKRLHGESPGGEPQQRPLDLYIGIDCSGSMSNPSVRLSYPVLAGTVITISALRTGARVMACLSGEPGKFTQTDGFIRDERRIMSVLTDYLGTGYAFGVGRLDATFCGETKRERATHILVVSDSDIFAMLDSADGGWDIARRAAEAAGGGATFVLEIPGASHSKQMDRLRSIGWEVYTVTGQEELVAFARAFAREKYDIQR